MQHPQVRKTKSELSIKWPRKRSICGSAQNNGDKDKEEHLKYKTKKEQDSCMTRPPHTFAEQAMCTWKSLSSPIPWCTFFCQTVADQNYCDVDMHFLVVKNIEGNQSSAAQSRLLMCLLFAKFHRNYSPGQLPDWTITQLSLEKASPVAWIC